MGCHLEGCQTDNNVEHGRQSQELNDRLEERDLLEVLTLSNKCFAFGAGLAMVRVKIVERGRRKRRFIL